MELFSKIKYSAKTIDIGQKVDKEIKIMSNLAKYANDMTSSDSNYDNLNFNMPCTHTRKDRAKYINRIIEENAKSSKVVVENNKPIKVPNTSYLSMVKKSKSIFSFLRTPCSASVVDKFKRKYKEKSCIDQNHNKTVMVRLLDLLKPSYMTVTQCLEERMFDSKSKKANKTGNLIDPSNNKQLFLKKLTEKEHFEYTNLTVKSNQIKTDRTTNIKTPILIMKKLNYEKHDETPAADPIVHNLRPASVSRASSASGDIFRKNRAHVENVVINRIEQTMVKSKYRDFKSCETDTHFRLANEITYCHALKLKKFK